MAAASESDGDVGEDRPDAVAFATSEHALSGCTPGFAGPVPQCVVVSSEFGQLRRRRFDDHHRGALAADLGDLGIELVAEPHPLGVVGPAASLGGGRLDRRDDHEVETERCNQIGVGRRVDRAIDVLAVADTCRGVERGDRGRCLRRFAWRAANVVAPEHDPLAVVGAHSNDPQRLRGPAVGEEFVDSGGDRFATAVAVR